MYVRTNECLCVTVLILVLFTCRSAHVRGLFSHSLAATSLRIHALFGRRRITLGFTAQGAQVVIFHT